PVVVAGWSQAGVCEQLGDVASVENFRVAADVRRRIVALALRLLTSAATALQYSSKNFSTPTGLRQIVARHDATPLGLKRFFNSLTQGSAFRATLGFGPESRWDSQPVCATSD